MSDGYKALIQEAQAKGRPTLLSFDAVPSEIAGVAFGIDYVDSAGQKSRRWVTARGFQEGLLWAYCWVRRDMRSFSLHRIEAIIDDAGEVRDPASVFPGIIAPRTTINAQYTPKRKRDVDRAAFNARVAERNAEVASERNEAKHRKEPDQKTLLIGRVLLVAIFLIVILFVLL
jgi:predicted DNA-binding transcriptional regulator YafY